SRIPAYEQGIDDIVGIVYVKDLFRAKDESADRPVREFLRPPRFVPESKRVSELMREMQSEKFHMAIVVDEYGGTAGLVTLEDLIEEHVGKSTLLNRILGTKVAIVSDKPQTTRTQVRGVLTRPDAQVVFVDTPGIHKPRTLLGERLNDTAESALGDVDVTCLVLDATAP